MNETLLKFKEVVDEEIEAYESLGDLYQTKQSLLIQSKSDQLWEVDSQITIKANDIRQLNAKRKSIAKYLGDENLSISEVINQARLKDKEIADKLCLQKSKLRILAKAISLQEKTNLTLIKHGLTMVDRSLKVIAGTIIPHSKNYDNQGKNIEVDKSLISSVVEEA